jgi:Leucine-rich repeat (LRR) protein
MASLRFVTINAELISNVTGYKLNEFREIQTLDLHLRNNEGKIRKIDNLQLVPNLRQLNLSYNAITKIEGLDRMVHLVELNLAENSIKTIEGLSSLRSLQKLNLSGNFIERIPESFGNLIRLSHLRIARNRLSTINDIKILSKLRKLTNLRIDENPLMKQSSTSSSSPSYFTSFLLFHVMSINSLNGSEVSLEMRYHAIEEILVSSSSSMVSSPDYHFNDLLSRYEEEEKLYQSLLNDNYDEGIKKDQSSSLSHIPNMEEVKISEVLLERLRTAIEIGMKYQQQQQQPREDLPSPIPILSSTSKRNSLPKMSAAYRSTKEEDEEEGDEGLYHKRLESSEAEGHPSYHENNASPALISRSLSLNNTAASSASMSMMVTRDKVIEMTSRIEKLTSKLLQSEKEKEEMKEKHEKISSNFDKLRFELEEADHNLERSLSALQLANDEIDRLRRNHDESSGEREVEFNRNKLENQELMKENQQLKKEVEGLKKENKKERHRREGGGDYLDEWKSQDYRNKMNSLSKELEKLRSELQHSESLNSQLEQRYRSLSSSHELLKDDYDSKASSIQRIENKSHDLQYQLKRKEEECSQLQNTATDLMKKNNILENEKSLLQNTVHLLENENQALIAGKSSSTNRKSLSPSSYIHNHDPVSSSFPLSRDSQGQSSEVLIESRQLTKLEKTAVEVLTAIFLEEIQSSSSSSSFETTSYRLSSHNNTSNNLKEACVKAAIRIVYSAIRGEDISPSSSPSDHDDGNDDDKENDEKNRRNHSPAHANRAFVLPFRELGDKRVLSRIVSEAMTGIKTFEDSLRIKEEIKQLQVRKKVCCLDCFSFFLCSSFVFSCLLSFVFCLLSLCRNFSQIWKAK